MSVPYEDLLTVGHIRRAHGLKGEVVVRLSTNRVERLDVGTILHIEDGELIVRSSRPKDGDFLVFFEGVKSREDAESLRGTELRAPQLDDPDELWVHNLIGSPVVDQSGVVRGVVTEVQANPASDLLVLDSGALVPLTFVVDVTDENIHVDVPDGLFDL
jgi:16S rRNA processing protein RimM